MELSLNIHGCIKRPSTAIVTLSKNRLLARTDESRLFGGTTKRRSKFGAGYFLAVIIPS